MKITANTIRQGLVPAQALRDMACQYGDVDTMNLDDAVGEMLHLALDQLLQPVPGSPADIINRAIRGRVEMYPLQTALGATLASVSRSRVPFVRAYDGVPAFETCITLVYDDGVRITRCADYGDHGFTLMVAGDGTPAFYTFMTSDGYYDSLAAVEHTGGDRVFSIVDRLHELEERQFPKLVGAIDPVHLSKLPRKPVEAEPEQVKPHEHMTLRQLYATPPSPTGRAPLGRR